MKTVLTLALAIAFVAGSTAFARDGAEAKEKNAKKTDVKAVENAKKTQSASSQDKGGVLLTGSYIKQKANKHGWLTDGSSQVIVLDRGTIERSGASDLKQVLIHSGIH